MSFVITAPDLVESAAQDLAGIRSTLAEASASAAGPTTGIVSAAQDEVSVAIASMFGNVGEEFRALSVQAQAFHTEFVNMLHSGAGAYLSAETANAGSIGQGLNGIAGALQNGGPAGLANAIAAGVQEVSPSIAGAPAALGALQTGGAPALMNGLNAFGSALGGPYQSLLSTTAANLQTLGNGLLGNPLPVLHQLVANQMGYGQLIASAVQNLPAELAHIPANVAALLSANPAAIIQQFVNTQLGYAQTVVTGLGSAAHDFATGVMGLPGAFQSAFQALSTGDVTGALTDVGLGFRNLFLTGFDVTTVGQTFVVTPTGALGDLLPVLAIPGQLAQNFTDVLPFGSIPRLMAQNATNVLKTLTDTSVTASAAFTLNPPPGDVSGIVLSNTFGLPLALGTGLLGAPVNALNAFGSSATSFVGALQAGNGLGAATALLDAPGAVLNGFLNGQSTFPLTLDVGGLLTTINLPLDGLLVPASVYSGSIVGLGQVPVFGTPLGGLLPDLFNLLPGELASAIGGAAAPFFPPPSSL
jgi:PE family